MAVNIAVVSTRIMAAGCSTRASSGSPSGADPSKKRLSAPTHDGLAMVSSVGDQTTSPNWSDTARSSRSLASRAASITSGLLLGHAGPGQIEVQRGLQQMRHAEYVGVVEPAARHLHSDRHPRH